MIEKENIILYEAGAANCFMLLLYSISPAFFKWRCNVKHKRYLNFIKKYDDYLKEVTNDKQNYK